MPSLDYELLAAARRVIEGSLAVVPGERVLIVADRERSMMRECLEEAVRWRQARTQSFVLEELGSRPLARLPAPISEAMRSVQASIFLASNEPDEVDVRRELIASARRADLRHAHMVGITREAMTHALAVDPRRIVDTSRALRARLRPSSVVHVKSAAGTDLEMRCDPRFHWHEVNGVIRGGTWQNLPTGEIFTAPGKIRGRFVADASLSRLPGLESSRLDAQPLTLRVEGERVVEVRGGASAVVQAVERFLRSGSNLDRVGLLTFGTNVGLSSPIGDVLADQTLPGAHLVLGTTYPELTGADWDAAAILVLTAQRQDIDLDGQPLLRGGRYLT